jgi:small subunit ribosomal protein S6
MRIYEEMFIVRPDATDELVDPLVEQLKAVVTGAGGTCDKVDKWGVRRLAYRVQKFDEGLYILIQFSTKATDTVKEVERRLRVSDLVLKHITVRIDEKLKRLDKRKKAREKRAERKPRPTPPAPTAEQQMLAGSSGPSAPPMPGAPVAGAPAAGAPAAGAPVERE